MSTLRIKGEGNFLITAPHTIFVKRPDEIHLPEIHIKKILKKLETKIGSKYLTTITWNNSNTKDTCKYKDPNYYPTSKLDKSIWYKTLQKIYLTKKKENLILIDLHGMNDENNYDIIIGFQALKKYSKKSDFYQIISNLLEVLEKFSLKYKLKIGYNIIFKGYINDEYYTISQQVNSIGIKGIQMELSKTMRERLLKEKIFLSNFAKTLLNFYKLNQK